MRRRAASLLPKSKPARRSGAQPDPDPGAAQGPAPSPPPGPVEAPTPAAEPAAASPPHAPVQAQLRKVALPKVGSPKSGATKASAPKVGPPPIKEPSARASTVKVRPGKAAPTKAAPSKAAPANTAPAKAVPANAAPAKAAPTNTAPTNTAPTKAAPANTAPVKADGSRTTSTRARGTRRGVGGDGAREALVALRQEVAKAVVGQDAVVTGLAIALLCRGHVLLEGVPGVAKTLLVRAVAAALSLDTKRVQFTPDLMPGDITGSLVYDNRAADFHFRPGPVFTNLLLADEINRTPPKTQASLLEAMEERQVSVDGTPRLLPDPFVVCATQNPVEYEGTYPLPEAQLDRFLLKLTVGLPGRDDEVKILAAHDSGFDPRDLRAAGLRPVAGVAELEAGRAAVRSVTVAPEVMAYVVDLCRATRTSPSLSLGVSPRGATALLSTAKAWAWLSGRDYLTPDDVKALARPTLRHRVSVRAEAELEGVTADGVLDGVLSSVPVPR